MYVTGGDQSVRHLGNAVLVDPIELPSPDPAAMPRVQPVRLNLDPVGLPFTLQRHRGVDGLRSPDAHDQPADPGGCGFRVAASPHTTVKETASSLRAMINELVDYMLFVDEAPLPSRIAGTSGFTERFSQSGPRDSKGRSLRQLDLQTRLLRYPCSYMIYTSAFDGLPALAREAIYTRMWEILSGADRSKQYARLSLIDRQTVVEILRENQTRLLPATFSKWCGRPRTARRHRYQL